MTIGFTSYGEFEFRRKIGRYYDLPDILPKPLYLKYLEKMKSSKADEDKEETSNICEEEAFQSSEETVTEEKKLIHLFNHYISHPLCALGSFFCQILQNLFFTKDNICHVINYCFLLINFIHLIFLGNLFQSPDMPFRDATLQMEKFHFASPKLAVFTFIVGHLC